MFRRIFFCVLHILKNKYNEEIEMVITIYAYYSMKGWTIVLPKA